LTFVSILCSLSLKCGIIIEVPGAHADIKNRIDTKEEQARSMLGYDEKHKFFTDGDEFQDLYLLFARARYLTFRAREKELQKYGLTPEQAQVLFIIQNITEKATPAEISRYILRQPHSVSAIVDRMVKKGLVSKAKDLERKNMVRVVVTDKGMKAYEYTKKRASIHHILSVLDENEREDFRKHLDKVMTRAREELGMDRDNLPSSD
jgi:DNA-binding MarR family transcriptional regulator